MEVAPRVAASLMKPVSLMFGMLGDLSLTIRGNGPLVDAFNKAGAAMCDFAAVLAQYAEDDSADWFVRMAKNFRENFVNEEHPSN